MITWARRRGRSFRFATRGLWVARLSANLKVHAVAAIAVAILAIGYGVTGTRLGLVVVSITTVVAAETLNTAVERVCDFIAELHGIDRDPRIRDIKDLAAATVLVIAVGAAVNGIIVFAPLVT